MNYYGLDSFDSMLKDFQENIPSNTKIISQIFAQLNTFSLLLQLSFRGLPVMSRWRESKAWPILIRKTFALRFLLIS